VRKPFDPGAFRTFGSERFQSPSGWRAAVYKRRQAMLMEMRAFEVIALMRDLNLTSYAFGKNPEELQAHIQRSRRLVRASRSMLTSATRSAWN
jgi:hypothetical protein